MPITIGDAYPFQADGVAWATPRKYGLIGDDPGLGKTLQLIWIAMAKGAKRILVICPKSVLPVWLFHFREMWPDGPKAHIATKIEDVPGRLKNDAVVLIVNYDRLSRENVWAEALVAGEPWDYCILDEAHALKDLGAFRTRRFYKKVFPHCKSVFAATATPMPNHNGELFPLLRFMAPETVTRADGTLMTQHSFEDAYCIIEQKHVGRGRPVRVITGSKNGAQLREKLGDFMLRRKKEDVLPDLPERRIEVLPLHPSKDAFATVAKYAEKLPEGATDDELLRHLQSGEHFASMMREIGMAKAGAVVPWIEDFLFGNKQKIVVWGVHHDVIDYLSSRLCDFNPAKIDGRDDSRGRIWAVNKFLNDDDCKVIVCQIRACGTGLTFLNEKTKPSDAIFVEQTFTPADTVQAIDRIHRIGQVNKVLARIVVADQIAIDRRVQNILAQKTRAISEVM